MAERIPMTRTGYDKLKAELAHLENVEMPEIAKRIADGPRRGRPERERRVSRRPRVAGHAAGQDQPAEGQAGRGADRRPRQHAQGPGRLRLHTWS